jgi:hypothetical protein
MKATLDNFLVKWDGNNPLWKELIEWLNKDTNNNLFSGDMEDRYYGRIEGKRRCLEPHRSIDVINILIITLEQWKELLTKTEKMNNFKNGDKVFVAPYGWCEYCHESVNVGKVVVKYKFIYHEVDIFLVSFTDYKLEGLTQERPFTPEVGKNYFFWNKGTLETAVVGWGMYVGKSNDELKPYIFGSLAFSFCSETNPLL